ncbi:MAG: ABC transporter permease [bacterium]|nr:ABC transporter permease [bacterium]
MGYGMDGLWARARRRLGRNRGARAGLVIVGTLAVAALLAPVLAPQPPGRMDLDRVLLPPGPGHPLGTDYFGRDMLSRLIYGARVSLTVGVVAQSLSATVGVTLGLVAGYCGGWTDLVIMRLVELMLCFPDLLLAVGLTVALGPGPYTLFLALGLVGWPGMARLVRGEALALRDREFLEAARATGTGPVRVLWGHLFPNCLSPVIIAVTGGMAACIMAEASLSFLGLGAQPPTPSWGSMLNLGRPYLHLAPHLVIFPGLAIALAVFGFNLLGDGLRDALDPRRSDFPG